MPSLAEFTASSPVVDNPEYFQVSPEGFDHQNGVCGVKAEKTPPLPPRVPLNVSTHSQPDFSPPSYNSYRNTSTSPPKIYPRASPSKPVVPSYVGEYIYTEPAKYCDSSKKSVGSSAKAVTSVHNALYHSLDTPQSPTSGGEPPPRAPASRSSSSFISRTLPRNMNSLASNSFDSNSLMSQSYHSGYQSRCSLEDIRSSEMRRQQAVSARLEEEAAHEAEKLRLDEIVSLCAEYQRQYSSSPPPQTPPYNSSQLTSPPLAQNRIKTNGSLPRDKRVTSPTEQNPPVRLQDSPLTNNILASFPPFPPFPNLSPLRQSPPPASLLSHPPCPKSPYENVLGLMLSPATSPVQSPMNSLTYSPTPAPRNVLNRLNSVNNIGNKTPCHRDSTPSLDNTPNHSDNTLRFNNTTPSLDNNTPSLGLDNNTSSRVNNTPSLANNTPSLVNNTPSLGNNTPSLGNNTPSLGNNTPSLGNNTPSLGNNTPSLGNNTPDLFTTQQSVSPRFSSVNGVPHKPPCSNLIKTSPYCSPNLNNRAFTCSTVTRSPVTSNLWTTLDNTANSDLNSSWSPEPPSKPPRSPRIQRSVFSRREPPPLPHLSNKSPPPIPPNKPRKQPTSPTSLYNRSMSQSSDNGSAKTDDPTTPKIESVAVHNFLYQNSNTSYENEVFMEERREEVSNGGVVEELEEEQLRAEWKEALQYTTDLKRSVADLARQEEEAYRELEVERALLEAECGDVEREVERLERSLEEINERSTLMEERHHSERSQDQLTVQKCSERVQRAEQELSEAEIRGSDTSNLDTDRETSLLEDIKLHHELLDAERKVFEDTEFGQLEREAVREAEREEINRELGKEKSRLVEQEKRLKQLKLQVEALNASVQKESNRMDNHRTDLNNRLIQERSRAKSVESKLLHLTGGNGDSHSVHTYTNTTCLESLDRGSMRRSGLSSAPTHGSSSESEEESERGSKLHLLCDQLSVMTHSVTSLAESKFNPESEESAENKKRMSLGEEERSSMRRRSQERRSLGENKVSSLMTQSLTLESGLQTTEDNGNRDSFSRKQSKGSRLKSDNEQRIMDWSRNNSISQNEYRKRVAKDNSVILDSLYNDQQIMDSLNGDSPNDSRISDANDSRLVYSYQNSHTLNNSQCSTSSFSSQNYSVNSSFQNSAGKNSSRNAENANKVGRSVDFDCTSTASNERNLEDVLCSEDGAIAMRFRGAQFIDDSRPISEASSSCSTGITLRSSRGSRQQRPLTRYLPIRNSQQFNLRQHIETAGHQIELCPSLILTPTTCRGYLHKMGGSFQSGGRMFTRKGWNKRWFVFDRVEKALVYYSDKSEGKPRGYMPFEDIEEVYVDHAGATKGGVTSSVKFIVKTRQRVLHLMACTPSAMRVWVEVIFTGAEGYNTYDN